MNVSFEVIDRDQRQAAGEGQSLGVGDANQQRAGEAGAGRDRDGIEIVRGCGSARGLPE
jgi:hypothetical protein